MEIGTAVDTAINVEGEIIALREQTESNFIALGALLDDFIARDLYKALGHKTINEWLDSKQLGIGRASGWKLIKVFRTFGGVQTPGLAAAGHEKLALLAPKVDAEVIDAQEAVDMANEFSVRELSRRFTQPRPDAQEKIECPTCHKGWERSKAPWIGDN